jgi:hypothetical protein
MTPRVDRYGEPVEDDEPLTNREGADLCRQALATANAARRCPYCTGQLKPGWQWHPTCKRLADEVAS